MVEFDVFLSHNSKDKAWVTRLKDELQEHGLKVWLDQDEIPPGDLFVKALERGIEESKSVVLVVSPEAMDSGWVEEEYARALALAKSKHRQLKLIPAILRDAKLPGFLESRNWVDFQDESRFAYNLKRLLWGITGQRPTDPQNETGASDSFLSRELAVAPTVLRPFDAEDDRYCNCGGSMTKGTVFPDNDFVSCTILAIDAVGQSRLVRSLAVKQSHDLFAQLESRVRNEVTIEGGCLLAWAGAGGVAAFSSVDRTDDVGRSQRALRAADNILAFLPALNGQHHLRGDDAVQLRLALHSGTVIWRRDLASIHSQDVNFVARLEQALPEGVVGISDYFYRALPPPERDNCLVVGDLEGHEIYIYDRDTDSRLRAKRRYLQKRTKVTMGEACLAQGLVHLEFRDAQARSLPDVAVYSQAQSELLMAGVTLASSFKQQTANPTLTALRAANLRGVRFRLLVLDPEHAGAPFVNIATGSLNDTLESLNNDVSAGQLRPGSIEVRGLRSWPHFTGIMIDGDVGGPAKGDLRGSVKLVESLLLRVQCTVPPEDDKAQHFAPIFHYGGGFISDAMYAFIRGFRSYWQTAKPLLSL